MRVKSRKPPAAKPRSSAASARAAISETSANERMFGARRGREHHARRAEELRRGGLHAARLAPRDGVPGHEAREEVAQLALRLAHHLALGAAHVGDHGAPLEGERHIVQHRADGANRHRHHDQLHALRGFRGRIARGIDHAQGQRALERLPVAVVADDGGDRARAPQRQRQRAADESHADEGDGLEAAHQPRPSARASDARKRAFCSGRPTVTRRCSGSP